MTRANTSLPSPRFARRLRDLAPVRCALIVLALGGLASAGAAQQAALFEGRVLDPKGKGVEGAKLTLTHAQDMTVVASGTSDKKGKFSIPVLLAGPYTLVIDSQHAPYRNNLTVEPGMEYKADLKLKDMAVYRQERSVEAFNDGVRALQGGQEEEAEELLKEAEELNPDLVPTHQALSALYHGQERWEESAAQMDLFLAAQPDDTLMAPVAFDSYFESGQEEKAIAALAKITDPALRRESAVRVYNAGVRFFQADDLDGALGMFERAAEIDPTSIKSFQNMAAIEFNRDAFDAATGHLAKLLELDPTNAEGNRLLFYSYRGLEDDRAYGALEGFLSTANADQTTEVVDLAGEQFNGGDADGAERLLQVIVKVKPMVPEGHYFLGRVLASKGQNDEAKQHLQHFVDMAPSHAEADAAKAMIADL
jgi:tetratricopeptide (TPR) repeat protein